MRPILLKGHGRPLTHVAFNSDGDLLFSCAKDQSPTVWYADNGERLGTYNGHKGAVWYLDVNYHSTLLLTGGADATARLWEVETGNQLMCWTHASPVRCVGFAEGDRMILTVGDKAMGQEAEIFISELGNVEEMKGETVDLKPKMILKGHESKISRALWGNLNQTIISCSDDGSVRLWDVETGKEIRRVDIHRSGINSMHLSRDKFLLVTAGRDHSSRLLDASDLTPLKIYRAEQPVNDAVISPLKNHIILGGGQEAMSVTTTSTRSGKFEAHFYHIYQENWLGAVHGHFGPINCIAISPDGKSYASGGEDGYVRLHYFDESYLASKDP